MRRGGRSDPLLARVPRPRCGTVAGVARSAPTREGARGGGEGVCASGTRIGTPRLRPLPRADAPSEVPRRASSARDLRRTSAARGEVVSRVSVAASGEAPRRASTARGVAAPRERVPVPREAPRRASIARGDEPPRSVPAPGAEPRRPNTDLLSCAPVAAPGAVPPGMAMRQICSLSLSSTTITSAGAVEGADRRGRLLRASLLLRASESLSHAPER